MSQLDFAQTYTDHKENVWKLVSKYVAQQQDREDLFQEVFLAIHRALPRFREEAAVGTWIYRIAVNTSINYLKKQKRNKMLKTVLAGMRIIEAEKGEGIPDISLLKPLEKLNPQQKMILILSDVEEKKHGEIAEMMDLPLGTIKSNLHRAREIVRKGVEKNG